MRKTWLSLSTEIKLVENEPLIIINQYPDAIYDKSIDTLYFKKLATISSIFKGIDILYREATDEETQTFLKQEFIKLEDGYNAEKVKKANRKRIAMALDTLKKFDKKGKKSIFKYIKEYCTDVKFNENSFILEKEEDLKKVLFGIEQRYYTTPIGSEKRLANSITKL